MAEPYLFTYKGVQYDATDYAGKHPGGITFLDNMRAIRKDFTEYFRALHSDQAEKILQSFRVVSRKDPSNQSEEYMNLFNKVEHFFVPIWSIEILLGLLVAATWLIGCTTSYPILSILCFGFTQILVGWMGHSCAHSRYPNLTRFGQIEAALMGGFSLNWWSPKHNMHHMFTNIQKYDQDIQHEYKVYLFPFLYLKWRFDSLLAAIQARNPIELLCIAINYACLAFWPQNIPYFIIGELIAGFYSAFVLIGNHEKEVRYEQNPKRSFVEHQIITCRNYRHENLFWLLLMGGMQYQTEHHLFPQIPFYNLPRAKKVIVAELANTGKTLIYGPVIGEKDI